MRFLYPLISLLAVNIAIGQGFTFRDVPWMQRVGVPPVFSPPSISGMAYYWSYLDLAASSPVTAWLDEIQSVDSHQGNSAKRPDTTTDGVLFVAANSDQLTNVIAGMGVAKFTMWIVFKAVTLAAGYHEMIGSLDSNNGFFSNGTLLTFYTSGAGAHNFATITTGVFYDMVYLEPGTGAAGAAQGYTNTAPAAATTSSSAVWSQIESKGGDNLGTYWNGYIKFIGIWTNVNLTLSQITNLYTYSTTH